MPQRGRLVLMVGLCVNKELSSGKVDVALHERLDWCHVHPLCSVRHTLGCAVAITCCSAAYCIRPASLVACVHAQPIAEHLTVWLVQHVQLQPHLRALGSSLPSVAAHLMLGKARN